MASHARCARCGEKVPAPKPLGLGLRPVAVCPCCFCLIVGEARDLGELSSPDDRADPTDWGGLGWL